VEEEDGESEGLDENIKIFERLVQRSALEEEVSNSLIYALAPLVCL
jgi:hypothetical protein